jgi:hypothetical protein
VRTGKQRVPALRPGDPRVVALLQAICPFTDVSNGFRYRDLRPLVASLLGHELSAYPAGAMTYDLGRLRLHGMIARAVLISLRRLPEGMRLAFGLSRIHLRSCSPTGPTGWWTPTNSSALCESCSSNSTLPFANSTPRGPATGCRMSIQELGL